MYYSSKLYFNSDCEQKSFSLDILEGQWSHRVRAYRNDTCYTPTNVVILQRCWRVHVSVFTYMYVCVWFFFFSTVKGKYRCREVVAQWIDENSRCFTMYIVTCLTPCIFFYLNYKLCTTKYSESVMHHNNIHVYSSCV